jgi:hypothetical protein
MRMLVLFGYNDWQVGSVETQDHFFMYWRRDSDQKTFAISRVYTDTYK